MKARQLIIAVLALGCASTALSQLSVYVWQENLQDRVVYHYRLGNGISHGLLGVEIGVDQSTGGQLQLTLPPIGVVVDEDLVPADGIGVPVPPASFTAPAGWTASVIGAEEQITSSLLFEVGDTGVLRAGQHRGFSISVPAADDAYRTGQWKAFMERGVVVWGALKPDDTEAPVPTAAVSGGGTACRNVGVAVTVALSGNGPWSLQWSDGQVQETTVSSVTRMVAPQTTSRYGLSSVRDVNRSGSVSGFADVNVLNPVSITTQPASKTVKKGTTTTLTVGATGAGALSWQWYKGATGVTSIPVGTNSSSFTTPKVTAPTAYWVRVTNQCGFVDSATSYITLQ